MVKSQVRCYFSFLWIEVLVEIFELHIMLLYSLLLILGDDRVLYGFLATVHVEELHLIIFIHFRHKRWLLSFVVYL